MAPATCLVVDDHAVLCEGIAALLEPLEQLRLVRAVASGEEAIAAIKRLRPQVVVVDIRLRGIDGLSLIKRVQVLTPGTGFVVYSAYSSGRLLSDALAAGARG